jgi:uncharacterized protein YkwD
MLLAAATAIAALLLTTPAAFAATRHHNQHKTHARRAHQASACNDATATFGSVPMADLKVAVVCLINQQRVGNGLPALKEDSRLDRSSQGWTNTMVATNQFTHGSNFSARITAAGFIWETAGENIATGYPTPASVVAGWMASPGHCRNILDPQFSSVGTGIAGHGIAPFGSGPSTWTQDFATPMGAPMGSNWGPANSVC